MARLTGSWILGQLLGRALLPHHVVRWMRRRRMHRRVPTVHGNAQLLLYKRMLRGDFLHYGYFDDPEVAPEEVSFDDLHRAQLRYAEKLFDLIGPPNRPVLDAGCGMGGMLGLLRDAGHEVTGLTPDRLQIEHIRSAYPGIPVLHCRFEDLARDRFRDRFRVDSGTIVHSESLQYMHPEGVFAVLGQIPGSNWQWIVADYFRRPDGAGESAGRPRRRRNRSGWRIDDFRACLREHGFRVVHEEDITAHVLPTLGFARLLADRIGLPALDFARDRMRAKTPALHYVVENVAERARDAAVRNAAVLDPAAFAAEKQYLMMSIRRG
ncbi:MAG: hypothetical protein F4123_12895 [Gemmatimonadetes bacterium]|nr:hypothetical protein [Gemmatimonadota bacterium]MYB99830.1 hypothetical protein [Gemmatimonadota bacterium]MYI47251.1 hypothetical protein [Gemmatimonadota bacterium]